MPVKIFLQPFKSFLNKTTEAKKMRASVSTPVRIFGDLRNRFLFVWRGRNHYRHHFNAATLSTVYARGDAALKEDRTPPHLLLKRGSCGDRPYDTPKAQLMIDRFYHGGGRWVASCPLLHTTLSSSLSLALSIKDLLATLSDKKSVRTYLYSAKKIKFKKDENNF